MTIPKIVILLDGGLVQDVLSTHQVEVFVLDLDVEGADKEDLMLVDSQRCWVSKRGLVFPDSSELPGLLADIEKGERP
jgi:hypothetical protein